MNKERHSPYPDAKPQWLFNPSPKVITTLTIIILIISPFLGLIAMWWLTNWQGRLKIVVTILEIALVGLVMYAKLHTI